MSLPGGIRLYPNSGILEVTNTVSPIGRQFTVNNIGPSVEIMKLCLQSRAEPVESRVVLTVDPCVVLRGKVTCVRISKSPYWHIVCTQHPQGSEVRLGVTEPLLCSGSSVKVFS